MPSYPEEMVAPMRAEVVALGATELKSKAEVDEAMAATDGTSLYFVNSVCGCAAGSARPGLGMSLQGAASRPDRIYTVFAGMEADAVAAVRARLVGFRDSSPFVALFKDGDLVAAVERHDIQRMSADELGQRLSGIFSKHCATAAAG